MNIPHCNHSDMRKLIRDWCDLGGEVNNIRKTGELRFDHPMFAKPVRVNGRRKDIPAKMRSQFNHLMAFIRDARHNRPG